MGVPSKRISSLGVALIVGIEESRLGRGLQCHRPLHVIVAGPDGSDLIEGQYWDLLKVQPIQFHPEAGRGIHPGELGRGAPGWGMRPGLGQDAPNSHGTSDKPAMTHTQNIGRHFSTVLVFTATTIYIYFSISTLLVPNCHNIFHFGIAFTVCSTYIFMKGHEGSPIDMTDLTSADEVNTVQYPLALYMQVLEFG